jgi:hypothetical protein
LVGSGKNGIEEMKQSFSIEQIQYGLLRTTTKVDLSTTTKFVYIYNLGENVKGVLKGRIAVMRGAVVKYFDPFHVDFEIGNVDELSQEIIDSKLQETTGTLSHVHETDFTSGKQERGYTNLSKPKPTDTLNKSMHTMNIEVKSKSIPNSKDSKTSFAAATQSSSLQFSKSTIEGLNDVHNNKAEINWMIATYENGDINKPIDLIAKGSNGVEGLKEHLKQDSISYGLIRVVDKIDGLPTVKFAYIDWIGPNVSVMKKAKTATHKGAINERFAPFHVEFVISEANEIGDDIVLNKVQTYSGSKSFVKV